MTRSGLIVAPLALLLAACGGNAELRAAGATSGAGGAAAGASSAGSTSSAGGAACAGYMDLAVDDGPPQQLASPCAGEWNPQMSPWAIGYLIQGGVVPPTDGGVSLDGPRLEMFGCTSPARQAPRFSGPIDCCSVVEILGIDLV